MSSIKRDVKKKFCLDRSVFLSRSSATVLITSRGVLLDPNCVCRRIDDVPCAIPSASIPFVYLEVYLNHLCTSGKLTNIRGYFEFGSHRSFSRWAFGA
jgi:hypothetical protein